MRPGLRRGDVWPLLALGGLVSAFYAPQLASGSIQYDGVEVHYSSQRYLSEALHAGHLPFWTSSLFTGFPFLADLQVGAWYPLNWPFLLFGIAPASISVELWLHSLIACGGAYALGLRLFGQPLPAVGVALFYGLSGWFATHSQHLGMVQTAAWLPWLVLLFDMLRHRLSLSRLGLAALLGTAVALPGHFQVALYAFCGVGAWAVLETALARAWNDVRRVLLGLLAVALGGGALAAVMILPAVELAVLSVRTRLNARDVNLGYFQLDSLLTLVQPDHFGLLSRAYTGPGDVTQHYFYASVLLVPLALLGARAPRPRRIALLLTVPFLWYAIGPSGGLFRLIVRLPGFSSVELPMHGWFLPALGLAVLGGAGLATVSTWLAPVWSVMLLTAVFVDVLVFNQLLNPLAYARQSFDAQYGAPLRTLQLQIADARPPLTRLYGPPLAAVGYRNHPLQSHVETTYGYNPLELAGYADYAAAAEANPALVAGMAATHHLADGGVIQPSPEALPLAFFARRVTSLPDSATLADHLANLDPAAETLLVGLPPVVQPDPAAVANVLQRGDDHLIIHVRSSSPNVLRVAIPAYPGWHASLNGGDLPVLTVDGVFQGIVVPAGEGDIDLRYTPRWFWLGALLSSLALPCGGAVLLAALSARRHGTMR